ncbi:STAS domain-containing protein [Actinomycetospora termitidis]|uniref:Anti-sigma factor antagonist n=1 Tax=Actinomycetospora termitidis TaxID=3053470 RepID=A0ABT7MEX4_9PSEU|nr:STAS domain-containing protein [Actinomycetospora sp. Odt1-22]MDL5159220.1 STAS domain-containing protein [Actinomycetospora sp. Odt1-22]
MIAEAPEFGVRIEKEQGPDGGSRVVVVVSGDVDYTHVGELESAVDHEIDRATGPLDLVVDLAAVPYCDSCGMRVLLGASQRVDGGGGTFVLRGVHGQPSRALRLTGLDRVLGA